MYTTDSCDECSQQEIYTDGGLVVLSVRKKRRQSNPGFLSVIGELL